METLTGVCEGVEPGNGAALIARSLSLAEISLPGPPDLCHFEKEFEKNYLVWRVENKTTAGYFHYVVGADTSSPAAVSTYMRSLVDRQENAGWMSEGRWRITKGTFCIFNAFSRCDVRVEVKFPGQTTVYAVNYRGERIEVDEMLWKEAFVSSCIRSLSLSYAHTRTYQHTKLENAVLTDGHGPNVRMISVQNIVYERPLASAALEEDFLIAVVSLLPRAAVLCPLALKAGHNAYNMMIHTVEQWLASESRPLRLCSLLEGAVASEPALYAVVSRALMRAGELAQARLVLKDALRTQPDSFPLLYQLCIWHLTDGNVEVALSIAKRLVCISGESTMAWLALAESYCAADMHEHALVALNAAPMRRKSTESLGMLAAQRFTGADRDAEVRIGGEMEGAADSDAEEELADQDDLLSSLSAALLSPPRCHAYAVLVSILLKVGWNGLLELRSRVFLMRDDVDPNGEAAADAGDDGAAAASVSEGKSGNSDNIHDDTALHIQEACAAVVAAASSIDDVVKEAGKELEANVERLRGPAVDESGPSDPGTGARTGSSAAVSDELPTGVGEPTSTAERSATETSVKGSTATAPQQGGTSTENDSLDGEQSEAVASTGADVAASDEAREQTLLGNEKESPASRGAVNEGSAGTRGESGEAAAESSGEVSPAERVGSFGRLLARSRPALGVRRGDLQRSLSSTGYEAEAEEESDASAESGERTAHDTSNAAECDITGAPASTSERNEAMVPGELDVAPGESGATEDSDAGGRSPGGVEAEGSSGADAPEEDENPGSNRWLPSGDAVFGDENDPLPAPDATPGEYGTAGKYRCVRWLDDMFQSLYEDLRAYSDWRAEHDLAQTRERNRAARQQARADSTVQHLANQSDDEDDEDDDNDVPVRSVREWTARGRLALRLRKYPEAETAFLTAVTMRPHTEALRELMRLYSESGVAREGCYCALELLSLLGSLSTVDGEVAVPAEGYGIYETDIERSLFRLIEKCGLQAVRRVLTREDERHPTINRTLLEAVEKHVAGFDR